MTQSKAHRLRRLTVRLLAAAGISVALSGCIIEPLWAPHYYRPYHYGYRGY